MDVNSPNAQCISFDEIYANKKRKSMYETSLKCNSHGVLTNLRVVSIPNVACTETDSDARLHNMSKGYVRDLREFICPVCGQYSHASSYEKVKARRVYGTRNAFRWAMFSCERCGSEFKTNPFIVTDMWFDERPEERVGSVLSCATLFEDSYFFDSVREIKKLNRKVNEDPIGIAIGVVVGMILAFIVLCLLPEGSGIKTILAAIFGAATLCIYLCIKFIAHTTRYLSPGRDGNLSATKKAP